MEMTVAVIHGNTIYAINITVQPLSKTWTILIINLACLGFNLTA